MSELGCSDFLRVLGLSLYGPLAASHRVRLSQFQPGLLSLGIDLQIQSLLDDAYLQRSFSGRRASLRSLFAAYVRRVQILCQTDQYDLAIVYGDLLPYLPSWLECRLLRIPFIYDCDDAFFLKYSTGRLRLFQSLIGSKANRLMSSAVAVTAGNDWLAANARLSNSNVTLLPSVVDTEHYRPVEFSRLESRAEPFTLGWIGSPSTAPYLKLLVDPLQQLACERSVRLIVVGGAAPTIKGVDVIELPWSLEQEVPMIQQFHVGVMPLPDTSWARGKCAYKLIQCMACGIPVVASPVGANVDVVSPECGLLAHSSDEWLMSLRYLAVDADRRLQMGISARQRVEQRYSLRNALPLLKSVIKQAVPSRHHNS